MKKIYTSTIYLFIVLLLLSCSNREQTLILISKDSNSRIEQWLKTIDPEIKTRVFYAISNDSMNYYLEKANAIVIGGGEDVNPVRYKKPEYRPICGTIDDFRDSIEFLMINFALEKQLPLLGICRGHQIMNVAMGGSLIPDIPTFYDSLSNHRSKAKYAHNVNITDRSGILGKLQVDSLKVNSRHHQSVDRLSTQLKATAYSNDGIVEAIESSRENDVFLLGVQWHPESLLDSASIEIGTLFLKAIPK